MSEADGAARGLPTVGPDRLADRGPDPASPAHVGGGRAVPPAQLTLGLGELARGAGVAVPARWAQELAEVAAIVERGTAGSPGRPGEADRQPDRPAPSGGADTAGAAVPPEAGSVTLAGAEAGENDPARLAAGPEQVAAFEDLHARLRQVLGTLDAG